MKQFFSKFLLLILVFFVINFVLTFLLQTKQNFGVSKANKEIADAKAELDYLNSPEYLALSKKTGPNGVNGLPGVNGQNGTIGESGASGPNGEIGLTGLTGDAGETDLAGDEGQQGAQGSQGLTGDAGVKGITTGLITGLSRTTSELTYYVSTTGSNVTGTGTIDNPFATPTYAINQLPGLIRHNSTVQLAPGTYADALNFKKIISKGVKLTIRGDNAAPASYKITGSGTQDYGFLNKNTNSIVRLEGVQFEYYKRSCLYMYPFSNIEFSNVNFYRCSQNYASTAIYVNDFSRIDLYDTINITGDGTDDIGFLQYSGVSSMYAHDNATVNIINVVNGINTFAGLFLRSSPTATWNFNNSAIAKKGTAIQAWHGENIQGISGSINNFVTGIFGSNTTMINVGPIDMINVTTPSVVTNGALVVINP